MVARRANVPRGDGPSLKDLRRGPSFGARGVAR